MALQIDTRLGACEAGPLGISSTVLSRAISSTGTSMRSFNCLRALAFTIVTFRYLRGSTSIESEDHSAGFSTGRIASVGEFFAPSRSEEHTSELQSLRHLVC